MEHVIHPASDCPVVILAGGAGRRMGGATKALMPLAGVALLDHVIRRLALQTTRLAVAAGPREVTATDAIVEKSASQGLTALLDPPDLPRGPLSGVLAALRWAERLDDAPAHVVTLPVDLPLVPADLITRLTDGAGPEILVRARSRETVHPLCACWPLNLAAELAALLSTGDHPAVQRWPGEGAVRIEDWEAGPVDPFSNVNTPQDILRLEQFLATIPAKTR